MSITSHRKTAVGTAVLAGATVALLGVAPAPASGGACSFDPTTTVMQIDDLDVPFGATPAMDVTVTSDFGNPSGLVETYADFDPINEPTALVNGQYSQAMPVLPPKDSYFVDAIYDGNCEFASSDSSQTYVVRKADVGIDPRVQDARAARFAATFTGSGGLAPGTPSWTEGEKARFKVVKQSTGQVVRDARVELTNSKGKVDFADLRNGRYRLVVKFIGSDDYNGAIQRKAFRVG